MRAWVDVAAETDCALGETLEVVAGGQIIALFRTEEGYFAIDGMCAHQGGPIAQGTVCKHVVTCPWHGWQYDIKTGQHLLSSIRLECFPVKVEQGRIFIKVSE